MGKRGRTVHGGAITDRGEVRKSTGDSLIGEESWGGRDYSRLVARLSAR